LNIETLHKKNYVKCWIKDLEEKFF